MPPQSSPFSDVSVIVPAYRSAQTIGRTLKSIARQTAKPREVIVVDDGSDDDTAQVARSFAGTLNGIELQVIEQQNGGAGAARNRALKAAAGKLVAFLDADDEWLPEKLERSLDIMAKTDAGLVSHNFIMVENDKEHVVDCTRHFEGHANPFVSLYLRGNIATSTVLAKRHLIDQAGGFNADLRSGQDVDLWLGITANKEVSFHIFSGALTRYHVTANSISSRVAERRRCAMAILLRHADALKGQGIWGRLNALLRAAIVARQASASFQAQGKTAAALSVLALAPLSVLKVGATVYAVPLAWLWIGGISLAYLAQFRVYIDPLLSLAGLK